MPPVFCMDQKHYNAFVHCLIHILRLSLKTSGLMPAQTDKELSNRLLELSKDGLEPVLLHDGTEREIPGQWIMVNKKGNTAEKRNVIR